MTYSIEFGQYLLTIYVSLILSMIISDALLHRGDALATSNPVAARCKRRYVFICAVCSAAGYMLSPLVGLSILTASWVAILIFRSRYQFPRVIAVMIIGLSLAETTRMAPIIWQSWQNWQTDQRQLQEAEKTKSIGDYD